jgi:hypothetical protein
MRRFAFLSSLLLVLCLAAPARSLPIDPAPPTPETAITSGPEDGAEVESEVVFTFSATLGEAPLLDATYTCSLDDGTPVPCSSPVVYEDLEEGDHTFAVAAGDPRTRAVDPEPATRTFSVAEAGCEGEAAEADEGEEAEGDEGEETEACEAEEDDGLPPRECLLRTARASVSAGAGRARLTLRYTTFSPTDAHLSYRLSGSKGALRVDDQRRHLSRRGVIRLNERLDKSETARVKAARRFTVEIDVPGVPADCRRFSVLKLSVKRATHSRLTWLQSR